MKKETPFLFPEKHFLDLKLNSFTTEVPVIYKQVH